MKKINLIIAVIILVAIITVSYFIFFREKKEDYSLVKAERGNVVQEVMETGAVKVGDEIELSFKSQGKIDNIYVKVGDTVKNGDFLAKLDNRELSLQLSEAQANLAVAQARLNKLVAGATAEEIKVFEAEVKNKQIAFETAKENLNQAYDDSLNTLSDSYLKIYNAFTAVDTIQRNYFTGSDQESLKVKENHNKITNSLNQAKLYVQEAKDSQQGEDIENALTEMKKDLNIISASLAIIRETCEQSIYQKTVSSTDKTTLDTHRANINTALTNVTAAQQDVSSMKLSQDSAQAALGKVQYELAQLKSPARQEDIDLYESQVKQAQASVDVLKVKIQETTIFSPTTGQITKIEKRVGETVQPSATVISMLAQSPFQVETDIYEEDIVKIKIGNQVDIKLTAFPDKIFRGKVIAIDPAEKIVEGIVYYEVTIDFQEPPSELKPGMTADIAIKTDSKENVLAIPNLAIQEKDGKVFVQILKDEKIEERQIQIGLKGSNDLVEVISGIEEGEEVILR